ncbi:MAG: hypothetical protein QGG56_01790 [Dehalococcoidia bacterium]|jgi:homoserine kinase|nr:hypothetical protein [Dehalococcoidia bacterium]
MLKQRILVWVRATAANLGTGFDYLGRALCIENKTAIADAMKKTAEGMGVAGATRVAQPALDGVVTGEVD